MHSYLIESKSWLHDRLDIPTYYSVCMIVINLSHHLRAILYRFLLQKLVNIIKRTLNTVLQNNKLLLIIIWTNLFFGGRRQKNFNNCAAARTNICSMVTIRARRFALLKAQLLQLRCLWLWPLYIQFGKCKG